MQFNEKYLNFIAIFKKIFHFVDHDCHKIKWGIELKSNSTMKMNKVQKIKLSLQINFESCHINMKLNTKSVAEIFVGQEIEFL